MPKPTTSFISDIVCQGASTNFTNTTSLNGTTITNWSWDFGDGASSTDQNPPANGYLATGDYNVKLTAYADNGCASNIAAGGNPVFCEGDSVKLSVVQNSSFNYQWKVGGVLVAGADSSVYYANGNGDYTVSVTNQIGGCNSESITPASVLVSATPSQPLIQSSTTTTFCAGDSVVLSVTDNVDYSYLWKLNGGEVGADTSKFIAKVSGICTLEVTNSTGCTSASVNSAVVVVNPVPSTVSVSVNGATDFCDGGSVELSVPDDPLMNYQWMDEEITISGAISNAYTATTTGNYKLVITNVEACYIQTQPKAVNVSPTPTAPTIATVGTETFCAGDSINFSVIDNPDLDYKWLQNDTPVGLDQNAYTANSTGTYSLEVTNSSNCISTSANTIAVTVSPSPDVPTLILSGPTTFCEDKVLTLSLTDPGSDDYQWMNELGIIADETGSSIDINETGSYKLRVRNVDLCVVFSEEIAAVVNSYPGLPTILTENYALDDCMSEDKIVLSVEDPESGINYQWKRNGLDIVDEIQSIYTDFLTEGEYSVEAENQGCFIESQSLTVRYGDMPVKPEIIAEGPAVWYLACSNDSAVTYRWYYEGSQIENAEDYLYVAGQQLGKYEVSISEGGCYVKSDPMWIPLGTGIDEDPFYNLRIYPNPTPGLFTLEMDNPIMGDLIIDIFGEQGNKIINIKFLKEIAHFSTQIDLSEQPGGVYLIGLMLEEYRASRSLVVE